MGFLVRTLAVPVRVLEKVPAIGWLIRSLSTSIGQKLVMAMTGLLLCGFLVAHLAGNLFLFVGADAYNGYAHALHEKEALLMVAEVGLFALFLTHIGLAISTSTANRKARREGYVEKETKQTGFVLPGGASSYMFATGAIVLGFLILHLVDFKFGLRPDVDYRAVEGNEFEKARLLLSSPLSAFVYLVGCLALGVHLVHGFASAFQTLGVNHPRYNTLIRWASVAFGWTIAVGFISFVLWSFASR